MKLQAVSSKLAARGTIQYEGNMKEIEKLIALINSGQDFVVREVPTTDIPSTSDDPIDETPAELDAPSTSDDPTDETPAELDIHSEDPTTEPTTEFQDLLPTVVSSPLTELQHATFPPKQKKRGRPKGLVTNAIGLPRKRQKTGRPQPYFRKTTKEKENMILSWFVSSLADIGEVFQESDVETIPENVPSCVLDSNVDVNLVRKFFSEEGWMVLQTTPEARKALPWLCRQCSDDLAAEESVGCESCLHWFHYKYANLKAAPRCKYWYCVACKNN